MAADEHHISSETRFARRRAATMAAGACSLAVGAAVLAIENMGLHVDSVQGAGWRAEDISLSISLIEGATRASVTIGRIQAAMLDRDLRNVHIECPSLETSREAFGCDEAILTAHWPGLGEQPVRTAFRYGRRDGAVQVALRGVRLNQGEADLSVTMHAGQWEAGVRLRNAPLDLLLSTAQEFGAPLAAFSADAGAATASATAHGSGAAVHGAAFYGALSGVTLNNESGSLATDRLDANVRMELRNSGADLEFSMTAQAQQGQAYLQPIFLDFGAHALALQARGLLDAQRRLILEGFSVEHEQVATATGRMEMALGGEKALQSLDLQLGALHFPGAYASYLQPLLLNTNFKAMSTAGRLSGRVVVAAGEPQALDLTLHDLTLDDGQRNFVLRGLQGRVQWSAAEQSRGDAEAANSSLRWAEGALLGLDVGAAELQFSAFARQLRLLRPASIPVFDGALEIERFDVQNSGVAGIEFLIDAVVQPISVQQLCKAFGWPEFGGSIGGAISQLRMQERVVTLGTTLQAQVFDGAVRIRDLKLEDPFGQWPRFQASIGLENLDLELVTRAFSFGRITGRLSGAIDHLQLFNWTPVAFDARLYTPADDRSRHRISQRAVQNIGSIGGGGAGVTAALSSGFLKFFDDFNYDRLGVSCRLENEVCYMDGVSPAPNGGYYLVKGKGLPRIDVIGSAHRVDWPRLVQQLEAATESAGPVVH